MRLELAEYRVVAPVLSRWDAVRLLSACPEGRALLDLGTREYAVTCDSARVCVAGECIARSGVEWLAESGGDNVYYIDAGSLRRVEVRGRGYLRLKLVGDSVAPTLEIDGIHMHRIVGIDPWRDSMLKVRAARVHPGSRVLDTCMGLGYTAIASLHRGASEVVTVELRGEVLWAAERNPWSRSLGDPRVKVLLGDVTEVVKLLPSEYFDRVIHDPPRFSSATGDLYGRPFYRELLRVLKPGGVLFHYTGEPGRRRGLDLRRGVARRLEEVGFEVIRYDRAAQGVVAVKPR